MAAELLLLVVPEPLGPLYGPACDLADGRPWLLLDARIADREWCGCLRFAHMARCVRGSPLVRWHFQACYARDAPILYVVIAGPCQVDPSGTKTNYNEYGWNDKANIVWIDQPGGAGFSYTDSGGMDHNQAEVSKDMYAFLQAYFKAHPEFAGRPFFITGEVRIMAAARSA